MDSKCCVRSAIKRKEVIQYLDGDIFTRPKQVVKRLPWLAQKQIPGGNEDTNSWWKQSGRFDSFVLLQKINRTWVFELNRVNVLDKS